MKRGPGRRVRRAPLPLPPLPDVIGLVSPWTRARLQRLQDFRLRGGTYLYPHASRGWPHVPVHPFADELPPGPLPRAPDDLTGISVDAYRDDVVLVQVGPPWPGGPGKGLHVRAAHPPDGYRANAHAVIDAGPVTRRLFEEILEQFDASGALAQGARGPPSQAHACVIDPSVPQALPSPPSRQPRRMLYSSGSPSR